MKKTFTLILLFVTYVLQAQKHVITFFDYAHIHPKADYYVNAAGQNNGSYKEYNENGVVTKEFNYLNGVENGACSEYAEIENKQRTPVKKANFKNGQLDGPFAWYCKYTGFKTKVSEGVFKNDQRTGLWKYWNCTEGQASSLTAVGSFTDGKKNGLWTYYYNNGKLMDFGKMINDKETGNWVYYDDNGNLNRKGSFDQGKVNGTWYYYSENDSVKPAYTGNWMAGNKTGEWVSYYDSSWNEIRDKNKAAYYEKSTYDNGVPVSGFITYYLITGEKQSETPMRKKVNYENDEVLLKKEGLYTSYYKNGQKQYEGYYVDDRETSTWKTFYENGVLKSEREYKDGTVVGDAKEYYESGKLKTLTNYNAGHVWSTKHYDESGKEQ